MDYDALINRLSRRGLFRIKPGLERVRDVLSLLGNPQDAPPSIHIAGTNGKGSVAASFESAMRHAGFRTGLYTSPHLWDVRERIQINRCPISASQFSETARKIFEAEQQAGFCLTYFEFLTVMAFKIFAEEAVDAAIVETGMGGRWDATNIIRQPALTVITSIGLDHIQWLGRTEKAIAREKAGIIKNGSPLVSGARGHAAEVIAQIAHQKGAAIQQIDKDFHGEAGTAEWLRGFQKVIYRGPSGAERQVRFGLLGAHQIDNAAVALAGLDLLREKGFAIEESDLVQGLATPEWPGRLQIVSASARPAVLFDGAHNLPALKRLLETLKASPWQHASKTFVFGVYHDKDYRQMFNTLRPHASQIILCSLPGPRALPPRQLAKLAKAISLKIKLRIVRDPHKALQTALQTAGKNDLIIVTGSLALVGMLLEDVPQDVDQNSEKIAVPVENAYV